MTTLFLTEETNIPSSVPREISLAFLELVNATVTEAI